MLLIAQKQPAVRNRGSRAIIAKQRDAGLFLVTIWRGRNQHQVAFLGDEEEMTVRQRYGCFAEISLRPLELAALGIDAVQMDLLAELTGQAIQVAIMKDRVGPVIHHYAFFAFAFP